MIQIKKDKKSSKLQKREGLDYTQPKRRYIHRDNINQTRKCMLYMHEYSYRGRSY